MRALQRYISVGAALMMAVMFSVVSVDAATLAIKTKDGLGSYLADSNGMTLYMFKKDTANKSVCGAANGCVDKWPVFLATETAAGTGINDQAVGTITRDDGKKQTTYNGMPLYYFFKDKTSGDTLGQGVNNVWYVVAP